MPWELRFGHRASLVTTNLQTAIILQGGNRHPAKCECITKYVPRQQCRLAQLEPHARYVKLWVAHAPGMPGTFSLTPRVSDPDMHHGTCVTHVPWCMSVLLTSAFLWSRWWGKRSRHSRRMRNPQFYVSGKRPIGPTSVLSSRRWPKICIAVWVNVVHLSTISHTGRLYQMITVIFFAPSSLVLYTCVRWDYNNDFPVELSTQIIDEGNNEQKADMYMELENLENFVVIGIIVLSCSLWKQHCNTHYIWKQCHDNIYTRKRSIFHIDIIPTLPAPPPPPYTRNHLFNMYTYKKKKKSTHGKQTDGKAIGQYS